MRKILLLIVVGTVLCLTGCVNNALVKSASAYYDSTKPYLEETVKQNPKEKESIELNMIEFKKMLDEYSAQKAWYEF